MHLVGEVLAAVDGETFVAMNNLLVSGQHPGPSVIAMYNAMIKKGKMGGTPHTGNVGDVLEAFQNIIFGMSKIGFPDAMEATKAEVNKVYFCAQRFTESNPFDRSATHEAVPRKIDPFHSIKLRVKGIARESAPKLLMNNFGGAAYEAESLDELTCDVCGTKGAGLVEHNIQMPLPTVLVMHVVRSDSLGGERNPARVWAPNVMRINVESRSKHVKIGIRTYVLRAVALHHGTSAEGGHYTALRTYAGAWWHIDDAAVSEIRDIEKLLASDDVQSKVTTMVYHESTGAP